MRSARVSMVLAVLLAGCGGPPGWVRAGADAPAAAREYEDCRAIAEEAVKPEIGINQDIMATRGNDWQRAQIGGIAAETMREGTRARAVAIVDSCMRAKGFARGP